MKTFSSNLKNKSRVGAVSIRISTKYFHHTALTLFEENNMLTLKRAREYLRYEPVEGKLFWKKDKGRARAGEEAGHIRQHSTRSTLKYRCVGVGGKKYFAHRLIWFLIFGIWPKKEMDHWDGDGLNNRLSNLREVTSQENHQNQRMSTRNASGVTGIYRDKRIQKWCARIEVARKDIYLGCFDSLQDAAAVRERANLKYGFTARHGKER